MPKVGAIAWVTAKGNDSAAALSDPFSGRDFRPAHLPLPLVSHPGRGYQVVVSQGLTLVKLLAVFLAIWSASTSIAEEIEENRLDDPRQTGWSCQVRDRKIRRGDDRGNAPVFHPPVFFVNSVSYKLVYEARELAREVPTQAECFAYILRILPGLILAFFETFVLAAISVAISTRLSLLPNLTICLTLYALGHIMPIIAASNAAAQMPLVGFFANLL